MNLVHVWYIQINESYLPLKYNATYCSKPFVLLLYKLQFVSLQFKLVLGNFNDLEGSSNVIEKCQIWAYGFFER